MVEREKDEEDEEMEPVSGSEAWCKAASMAPTNTNRAESAGAAECGVAEKCGSEAAISAARAGRPDCSSAKNEVVLDSGRGEAGSELRLALLSSCYCC
jgi:hypothetical protein